MLEVFRDDAMRVLTPEQHERACRRVPESWRAGGVTERLDAVAFADCVIQASLLGSEPGAVKMVSSWLPPRTGLLSSQTFRQMWRAQPPETRLRMPDVQGRWHLETQSHTFRHLRRLWPDDSPRVMIDLGCHAGHTYRRNVSDALLWLDRFHHPGGAVLGVDIIEDFAFDLQHRLDYVPPYASLQVQKLTRTLAIGSQDGRRVPVDKQLTLGCTGTWYMDWDQFERTINLDHYCRIPRQRRGIGSKKMVERRQAALPAPPPSAFPEPKPGDEQLYQAPTLRLDSLWRSALGGRHVDFLKIDVDMSWRDVGMESLLREHGASVVVIEVDSSWRWLKQWGLNHMDQLCWFGVKLGYTPLLKVPCLATGTPPEPDGGGGGGGSGGGWPSWQERGMSTWYHPLSVNGTCFPLEWLPFGGSWGIHDMMLVDTTRHPQLATQLVAMGRQECVPPRLLERVGATNDARRVPKARLVAADWLARAPDGFCGVTSHEAPGDCGRDDSGVLGLLPGETRSVETTARACLARCNACERCNFVSFSRRLGDCSWYARCDTVRTDVKHFRSGPALKSKASGDAGAGANKDARKRAALWWAKHGRSKAVGTKGYKGLGSAAT